MRLIKYRILIAAVPFPFQGEVEALDKLGAIKKVKKQAEICGLRVGRGNKAIETEILGSREVGR